ncbi:DNA glycosylase [Nemania serpens]|nr:DNA glycosylase [Nemania serpens]
MSLILATPSSQPLSLFKSSLVSRTFAAKTSLSFHFGETSYRKIQPLDWDFGRPLKTISRGYQSCPLELHGKLHQLKRPVVASHLLYIRKFTPHLTVNKNSKSHPVANMSTRRSARLVAAAELEASSSASLTTVAPPPPVPAQKGRKRKTRTDEASDETATEAPTKPAKTAKTAKTAKIAKASKTSKTSKTTKASKASDKGPEQRTSTPPPAPTPTPSSAKLIGEPAAPGDAVPVTPSRKKPRAAAVERLADSNATLATLLSPETSRIVTNKKTRSRSPSASPTKKSAQDVSAPKAAATANILEEGNRFLVSVDPRMRPLVEKHHCRMFSPEGLAEEIDPFESLCSGIISQQVSGAAAKSIKKRFIGLFYEGEEDPDADEEAKSGDGHPNEDGAQERRFPHPSQVVEKSLETLRTAGLSQRKAEYLSGLAEKFVNGELSAQLLADAPYEEVIAQLTAVRGLGLWSAEMFACFALKRIDVCSLGDLGVQRGMAAFVGRDVAKLKSKGGGKYKYMSLADMQALSEKFKPYRTLFMWYMWRVEPTDVSTME